MEAALYSASTRGLNDFSDLIHEVRGRVVLDALDAGIGDNIRGLDEGGVGAAAYADAAGVYLALAVSKLSRL